MNTFCIIGSGKVAGRHIDAINKLNGKITYICNTHFGEHTWKSVIDATKANYVVILSPNYLHAEMALYAAQRNKIVLIEKPMCLTIEDAMRLSEQKNIFTVLQLRHHEVCGEIKKSGYNKISIDINLLRDEHYFKSWKSDDIKSGGLLFNVGIHYVDLMIHLFGYPREHKQLVNDKYSRWIHFYADDYDCDFKLTIDNNKLPRRIIFVDGVKYNLSDSPNLCQDKLHDVVYKNLVNGIGTAPSEQINTIKLLESLK